MKRGATDLQKAQSLLLNWQIANPQVGIVEHIAWNDLMKRIAAALKTERDEPAR